MTIQQKNVTDAVSSAVLTQQLAKRLDCFNNTQLVMLFHALQFDTPLDYKHPEFPALQSKGFCNELGVLHNKWFALRDVLFAEIQSKAGCNLLPSRYPISIKQQGHHPIKGESKIKGSQCYKAEKVMINTAFAVNDFIYDLALTKWPTLSPQDRLAHKILADYRSSSMYFPISYDYRGRMYYRGGIVTPQGTDFLKAVLCFSESAPLGPDGLDALEYAFIDAMGYKGNRIEQANQITTEEIQKALTGDHGFLAAAIAFELNQITEDNQETFISSVVCHQDATCSGLQISAAMTGDRTTAELTNCTASTIMQPKQDVYREVSDFLAEGYVEGEEDTLAAYAYRYGRELVKKAVMTMGYGAGKGTLVDSIEEYVRKEEPYNEVCLTDYEQELLMEALEAKCGASNAVKDALQACVEISNDLGEEVLEWDTLDGFYVKQSKEQGEVAEYMHSKMEFNKVYDKDLNLTAISPNFHHTVDGAIMRDAVRNLDGLPVACIHDSLGTRACDYALAAKVIRHSFVEVDAKGMLHKFLDKYGVAHPHRGDYCPTEAQDSAWFFC